MRLFSSRASLYSSNISSSEECTGLHTNGWITIGRGGSLFTGIEEGVSDEVLGSGVVGVEGLADNSATGDESMVKPAVARMSGSREMGSRGFVVLRSGGLNTGKVSVSASWKGCRALDGFIGNSGPRRRAATHRRCSRTYRRQRA